MEKKIYLILFGLIFTSCQTIVRYSDENNIPYNIKIESHNKQYNKELIENSNNQILEEAKKWIGTPYCLGGESKTCTDCSGFVQSIFLANGIKLPRTAQEQFLFSKSISDKQAKPSDLVFFGDNIRISHVGIYIGQNYFIHSSSSKGVIISSLEELYYKSRFKGFKRVL